MKKTRTLLPALPLLFVLAGCDKQQEPTLGTNNKDSVNDALDRRPNVGADHRRVGVVHEHVRRHGAERRCDRREALRIGAGDARDEPEIVGRPDRGRDRPAGPAGHTCDADPDHVTAACDFTESM